jgi:hypothetical protein
MSDARASTGRSSWSLEASGSTNAGLPVGNRRSDGPNCHDEGLCLAALSRPSSRPVRPALTWCCPLLPLGRCPDDPQLARESLQGIGPYTVARALCWLVSLDQPLLAQAPYVVGDERLGKGELSHHIGDGPGTARQPADDLESVGFSKRPQEACQPDGRPCGHTIYINTRLCTKRAAPSMGRAIGLATCVVS